MDRRPYPSVATLPRKKNILAHSATVPPPPGPEVYKVPVRGLDKKSRTHIITAGGLPSIIDGITDIKVNEIASHLHLRRPDIHRDNSPIDLLVGIDHPKFHGGETREGGTFTRMGDLWRRFISQDTSRDCDAC